MPSLVVKVRTNMALYAHEKVRGLLEGEYGSVFKGRSMDFDDLREYIPGDDIKDIDWKATARSGQTLIKRYIAIRKHNVLLVSDTGLDMTAVSESGELKRDIGVMAAGVVGYIAQKHGDLVAMVAGDDSGSQYIPLKGDNTHLERILQHIHTKTSTASSKSNIARQLEYIARNISRRMMLVIISDDVHIDETIEKQLRRLRVQHEIIWVTVADANVTRIDWQDEELYDIAEDSFVPPYIRFSKKAADEYQQHLQVQNEERSKVLSRLNISTERITTEQDVVRGLFRLLEKQRYAKRR